MVHPDDREMIRRAVGASALTPVPLEYEARIIRRDGSVRVAHCQAEVQRDAEGRAELMRGTFQDVTERRRLEEQLRHSQKMEAVGRLAGGVAHDFNNLVTVINGYCDLILAKLGPDDPIRPELEAVHRAGERSAALTQQLLAFSRKQVVEPRVVNLNELLTDLNRILRRLIGEDIELTTKLDPALGYACVDRGQMDQVLINLAVNARDAMPGGGRLMIETSNIELDERYASCAEVQPGAYVMVTITDTGVGMGQEIMGKIFEPFFTTKKEGIGTGLGLSTVYGIIKQCGGAIRVHSEPGRGSTFKIYLPRVAEEAAAPEQERERVTTLRGTETILLVEDQEELRRFTATVLRGQGYEVVEAANAAEALQLAERYDGPIQLMLTDVVMPGLNGEQLANRLRPLRPEMRVLFMSGYPENVIAHEGVLDSGVHYIQKPFTPYSLASKVRAELEIPPDQPCFR